MKLCLLFSLLVTYWASLHAQSGLVLEVSQLYILPSNSRTGRAFTACILQH